MAPKEIMGVTLPTDPPPDDDPPPPVPPPRARQQSRPRVEDSTPPASEQPEPSAIPTRTHSPPGGIKLELGRHRITVSQLALVAILASFGGAGVAAKVVGDGKAETSDVLAELRAMRTDVKAIKRAQDDLDSEVSGARSADKKILNYVDGTTTPMVASLRKLGVKLAYEGDSDPASEVEFHPAPLQGSTAPPIQPKAVLPERPKL